MANTKITLGNIADDAVGLDQLNISNSPSNGQALTAASDGAGGYNLTWSTVSGGVDGISSSADATAITIDSSERVAIGSSTANKIFNIADPNQGGETLKLHFEAESSSDKFAIYSYDRTNSHYANMSLGQNGIWINGADANIGMGTTTPSSYNSYGDNLVVADSAHCGISIVAGNTSQSTLMFADGTGGTAGYRGRVGYDHNEDKMVLHTAAAERLRIDGSGCVLVNKTSQTGNAIAGLQIKCGNASSGAYSFAVRNSDESQNALLIENHGRFHSDFIYNTTTSDGANLNISTSSILRRSTSSRRYKTNIRDYDKGIAEIQTLSPKYFNGINDGDIQFAGLIAEDVHDAGLTEFVQYNSDDEPDSLAYSHMVALLVKGMQELKTELDAAKARIETLESN